MVSHGEFIEKIGEVGIGLPFVTFSVAVDTFFKVFDGFRHFFLLKTIRRDFKVHMTGF
jgi:hypothetical protein